MPLHYPRELKEMKIKIKMKTENKRKRIFKSRKIDKKRKEKIVKCPSAP